jgi:hypothetical protein
MKQYIDPAFPVSTFVINTRLGISILAALILGTDPA